MRVPPYLMVLLLLSACGSAYLPAQGAGGLFQDAGIFVPVAEVISTSMSRVLVEMYEFGRTDLEGKLAEAHRRGADVRVVLDPTVSMSLATGRHLAAAGVPVRFYPVDDSVGQIDHVKLLLGDSSAVVGGMNWGPGSARNHDFALLLRSPTDLDRLSRIFEQDWALAGGRPAPLPAESGPIAQTAPGSEIRRLLESALASARLRIEAEVFALTDSNLLLLLEQASRRGVDVRVILDPGQDVNRLSYSQLRQAGPGVRWFRSAPGGKIHAKAVLAGDRLVVGSANWSRHGLDINHELDVVSVDREAVAAFAARFEADWTAAGP